MKAQMGDARCDGSGLAPSHRALIRLGPAGPVGVGSRSDRSQEECGEAGALRELST